jgi:hypothetical protein
MKVIDLSTRLRARYGMRLTRCLVLALMLAASAAGAQPETVVIRGRVVADADNRPLRRALVKQARVTPPVPNPLVANPQVRPVLTDEDGRFEIELPGPSAELIVAKAGYTSIVVTPDKSPRPARELDIRLARGAALSGRVVEPGGAPATGARVMARWLEDPHPTTTFEAETDERGEYRIGGLPAGTYLMAAGNMVLVTRIAETPGAAVTMTYLGRSQGLVVRERLVFPGLTPGQTGPTRLVEVRAGEETGDVDFESVPDPLTITPPRAVLPDDAKIIEPPAGRITGRVVTPLGQPVANARVVFVGNNRSSMTLTDVNGRFDVRGFPDGDYRIETARFAFTQPLSLPGASDQESNGVARRLRIGGDRRVHDIELVLAPGGVISGAIVDSAGEPFQDVTVRALRLRHDGQRAVATPASPLRLTDDRGRYRVSGLPPGSYLIVATIDAAEPSAGRSGASGFAPMYYPGTAHVEAAQPVQVELAGDISGVDLAVAVTSMARVTGTALNEAGEPLKGRVTLGVTHRSGSVAPEPQSVQIKGEGAFELANVPPGDYVLQVHGEPGPGTRAEFGAEYISIGENDPPPLKIRTSPGATLEGRFVNDAGASVSMPMRVQSIHAAPMDLDRSPPGGRGPQGLSVHDDGRFYLTGLYGSMRLTYPASPGWYLKSVRIGGLDVTDGTFDFGYSNDTLSEAEIVLSREGGSIEGSVASSARRGEEIAVVAFPVDRMNWFAGSRYLKRATVSLDRSFDIDDLPPGDYFVAPVDRARPGDWQAPSTLETLVQSATRVTVRESQVRTLTLRLP